MPVLLAVHPWLFFCLYPDQRTLALSVGISASDADYERYVSHHRHATLTWARLHPGHRDHADVLAKSRADWMYYLTWIRPYLGWTIFVGRKAGG